MSDLFDLQRIGYVLFFASFGCLFGFVLWQDWCDECIEQRPGDAVEDVYDGGKGSDDHEYASEVAV